MAVPTMGTAGPEMHAMHAERTVRAGRGPTRQAYACEAHSGQQTVHACMHVKWAVMGAGYNKLLLRLQWAHNGQPERPVVPPRERLRIDRRVVLLSARHVRLIPQPGAEPEGQRWAAHAALQ